MKLKLLLLLSLVLFNSEMYFKQSNIKVANAINLLKTFDEKNLINLTITQKFAKKIVCSLEA